MMRVGLVGIAVVACLAGCAEVPIAPPAPTAPVAAPTAPAPRQQDDQSPAVVARHQRAVQYRAAGDLSRAEAELHVLTLLAPDVVLYRDERNAVRAEIARTRDEQLRVGTSASRSGDAQRAADAFLRVLAVDPENAEAAVALRDLDRRKATRVQSVAAARASQTEAAAAPAARNAPRAPPAAPPSDAAGTYDLEQRIEMFNAGDVAGGLRELRAFVAAHPRDRDARVRVGNAVYDRAREVETKDREQALMLYETAVTLRGDTPAAWSGRIVALRKVLSNDYYDRGTRAMRTDLPSAIKLLEASVRYDPANARAAARLAEARNAQTKLNAIGGAH